MVNNKSLVILAALAASAAAHFSDAHNADGSVSVPGTAGPGPAAGGDGSEGDAPTPDGELPVDPAPADADADEYTADMKEEIATSDAEKADAAAPAEGGDEDDGGSNLAPIVVVAGAGGAAVATAAAAAAGVDGDAAEAGLDAADAADAAVPAAATAAAVADNDASSTDEDAVAAAAVDADADASFDPDATPDPLATDEPLATPDKEELEALASDEDDDSVCFPGSVTVELESGAVVRMDDLSVGDMVKVGVNKFSRVFMFTHKMAEARNAFVSIKTASGAEIALTSGHYLYVNGALAAAKTVVTGDVLTLGNGDATSVTSVDSVEGTGLFNPQTVSGNVVVSGLLSSTYTTAVEPSFAHALLAPFRALQNLVTFTGLESGGGALADVAPRGQTIF